MKTYTIICTEDAPRYGVREIEATNDKGRDRIGDFHRLGCDEHITHVVVKMDRFMPMRWDLVDIEIERPDGGYD